jgi:hypothetical protein
MGWTTTDEISRRRVSVRSVSLAQSSDFEFICEIKIAVGITQRRSY